MFEPNDITLGMVAYFIPRELSEHEDIVTSQRNLDGKLRPFVCYLVQTHSFSNIPVRVAFTPLTSQRSGSRVRIGPEHVRVIEGIVEETHASRLLREGCSVFDGASSFLGFPSAFTECSTHDRFRRNRYRPFLDEEAVAMVRQMVRAKGGFVEGHIAFHDAVVEAVVGKKESP